jgi:hypothetical protein
VEPHYWLGRTLIELGQATEGKTELAIVDEINAKTHEKAAEVLNQVLPPTKPPEPVANPPP